MFIRRTDVLIAPVSQVLQLAEQKHVVNKLGVDFSRDEFYSLFGQGSTFPQVIVDDKSIGGCMDTVSFLREKTNLMDDLDAVVESAIDYIFTKRRYVFDFDHYLRSAKITGPEIKRFIESSIAANLSFVVDDLDLYLEGGSDNLHKQLREALYGYIPKPEQEKLEIVCIKSLKMPGITKRPVDEEDAPSFKNK